VVMLERGREPLAVGRRRRRATKGQHRALLHRDGGCARPGCPETRIERLHAHHMRHWLFGGRTDLANLVLLCDTDHGLVHDHELVMSRQNGRLIVLTPDGRHIWGTADAAFGDGLAGANAEQTTDRSGATARFIGVPPIDHVVGRRPTDAPRPDLSVEIAPPPRRPLHRGPLRRTPRLPRRPGPRGRTGRPPGSMGPRGQTGRPANRPSGRHATLGAVPPGPARETVRLSRVLFPDGEPALAHSLQENYERMDLRFAIGVLMGNRELARRLAAEAGLPATG
jgi:hypothetical protein